VPRKTADKTSNSLAPERVTVEKRVVAQIGRLLERRQDTNLRTLFPEQERVKVHRAKRKVVRAGRRGGKTVGAGTIGVEAFLGGRRVLYAVPTSDQLTAWWFEVTQALESLIESGVYRKNETEHSVERVGTKQKIRGKTAWNADTLRGDYADLLILDEWQLCDEEAWDRVGVPMLLDNNGDAIFIYTPPSLASRSVSKARDPQHAAKMFKAAQLDETGRWAAFTWPSSANPHISDEALHSISSDMTMLSYRNEILAEDLAEAPGALWKADALEKFRVLQHPDLVRVGVGVDPPGGATECGIVGAGIAPCNCKGAEEFHAFVIADKSLRAPPDVWAKEVVACYNELKADRIYGEKNFGGDMVETTIKTVSRTVSYENVHASRGKAIRAEPISALYEQGRVHHVGQLQGLEAEMISWMPGVTKWSPNRIDALVWVLTKLTEYWDADGSGTIGGGFAEPIMAGIMNETI
jgi:hypothetical protein